MDSPRGSSATAQPRECASPSASALSAWRSACVCGGENVLPANLAELFLGHRDHVEKMFCKL